MIWAIVVEGCWWRVHPLAEAAGGRGGGSTAGQRWHGEPRGAPDSTAESPGGAAAGSTAAAVARGHAGLHWRQRRLVGVAGVGIRLVGRALLPTTMPPRPWCQPGPTEYIQQAPAPPAQAYWYYCANAGAYYPYVKDCPGGWMQVVPPAPPGQ
jgi:hypothetical protein